jgi:hypothetical protein
MENLKLEDALIDNVGVCSFEDKKFNVDEDVVNEYLGSSSMATLACLDSCCGCKNVA